MSAAISRASRPFLIASWRRAGERGEHEVAGVRVALGNLDLIAVFDGLANARHVGEIELRVNALREQIQAQRDEIHVAGTLAVAE